MNVTDPESRTYGPYDVEHLLGRGAMGTVYAARDRRIGRRVALKTIRIPPSLFPDSTAATEFFKRLQREAEVTGSLLHPNIVTLYEAGYEDGRISYLAMELVEGETLLAMMKRQVPVSLETALRIAEDVLRGLAHAHEKAIIHRDIKPANILLAADGSAKIGDFGIARPQNSSMTGAGALMGTPNYMSPEQVLGKPLTPRADLFSLGVVLYEMLTGSRPFGGTDIATILHNILRQEVPHASDINPAVPRPAGDFIARLMDRTAEARPDAAQALEEIVSFRSPGRRPAPIVFWMRRLRPFDAALVIGIVLIAAILPMMLIRSQTHGSPTIEIPLAQLREFESKRRALDEAKNLYDEGKYAESLQRYDDYLQKYPESIVAKEGRERAKTALDAQKKKPPTRRARKKDEDISPSELLNRLKRAIRH